MYRNWRWSFSVYTACFSGRTLNQSQKVFIVALSDDHNLNDSKSILTLPPNWNELKKLWPFMTLVWATMPPSKNSGAMKICWKWDICGKESFHFLLLCRFSRFQERKMSIYELLTIFTCTTKFSWKSFHQSQRWLKRYFCWATKLPLLMLYELRASILRFNSFIRRNLICSFTGMRLDKDLCFNQLYRFWKQFLKQSNFGSMLV